MKKDEYSDIQQKINSTDIERPESLSKENVVELIKGKGIVPLKKQRNTAAVKRIASIAAAFCVLVAALAVFQNIDRRSNRNAAENERSAETVADAATPTSAPVATAEASSAASTTAESVKATEALSAASTVSDYSELENYFVQLYKSKYKTSIDTYGEVKSAAPGVTIAGVPQTTVPQSNSSAMTTVPAAAADSVANEEGRNSYTSPADKESYGKTNTQVTGVDEADIIKNDGKYLYTVNSRKRISIIDPEKMSLLSEIKIEDKEKRSEDENGTVELTVSNIYLNGNTLVAVCQLIEYGTYSMMDGLYCCCCYNTYSETVTIVYDITDRSGPVEVRRFSQDGSQVSSRMVGSVIYNVTAYNVNMYSTEDTVKNSCIPEIDGKRVDMSGIYWEKPDDKNGEESTNYIVVSAFDTASSKGEIKSLASLGSGTKVYCTEKALFVANEVYHYNDNNESSSTEITAFSIDGTSLVYKTKGTVPGISLNQFSMDEYNGYFRIATTLSYYNTYTTRDQSNVYVLDSNLKIVGKLEDLAHDEEIKAVRFMGNTAYVVTYVNTDPLFVIDLSDPTAPKVLGEVKLPGFSTYMHPVGDGLIAGVGYGEVDRDGYNSVKVSLFDVSDPASPKEINNVSVNRADTLINSDPKAFMYYPEQNLIGIPITKDKMDSKNEFVGTDYSVMLIKVTKNGLEKLNTLVHTFTSADDYYSYTSYIRATYIGQNLYTLSPTLINRFDLTSFKKTGSLDIEADPEEAVTDRCKSYVTDDVELFTDGGVTATMPPQTEMSTTLPAVQTTADVR